MIRSSLRIQTLSSATSISLVSVEAGSNRCALKKSSYKFDSERNNFRSWMLAQIVKMELLVPHAQSRSLYALSLALVSRRIRFCVG